MKYAIALRFLLNAVMKAFLFVCRLENLGVRFTLSLFIPSSFFFLCRILDVCGNILIKDCHINSILCLH